MKEFDKKINKIAKSVDLPIWLVKESLGIPLAKMPDNSFSVIKLAYLDADNDSEEQRVAYEKICLMLKQELRSSNLLRTKEIYELAIEFQIPEIKIDALYHWNDLSTDEVAVAKNYEELELAHDRAHPSSSARRDAIEKQTKFAERDYLRAHTFPGFVNACKHAPRNSDLQRKIIKTIYERYFERGDGSALE